MKAIAIVILLSLASVGFGALIGSTIYTLTRQFQYQLELSLDNQTLTVYATLSPAIDLCPPAKCFLGWISNYSLNANSTEGFKQELGVNNPLFFAEIGDSGELTITINRQLNQTRQTLMELAARLLTPVPAALSNLFPNNDPQLFTFLPLLNQTPQVAAALALKPQDYTFSQVPQGQTAAWAGWSSATPGRDLMLYDKGVNCLVAREVWLGETRASVRLVSKSIFSDLTTPFAIMVQLQAQEGNTQTIPAASLTELAAKRLSSLFLN